MSFATPYLLPNGITALAHRVRKVEAKPEDGGVTVFVANYATEADLALGRAAIYDTPMLMPLAAIKANFWNSVEDWVTSTAPFIGATKIKPTDPDPLIAAKDLQWEVIKASRGAALAAIDLDASQPTINAATKAIRDTATSLQTRINAAISVGQVQAIVWGG